MQKIISINLIYIRGRNHLSQRQLAEKLNITQTTLSNYEIGRNEPTLAFIIDFCKEFDLSIDDIVYKDLSKFKNRGLIEKKELKAAADPLATLPLSNESVKLYEKLIAEKDKTLSAKDELLEAKDVVIEKTETIVKTLEKHNTILETLLNQNGKM